MNTNDRKTPFLKSKTNNIDNIEEFCNLLTPERIKLLNLIFKESNYHFIPGHVEIRNKKETKIKDREKIKERENRITKSIFLNECREVFKKDKESMKDLKESKGSRTDRSDFENIFQVLFNRFKVFKDLDIENCKNKNKSQAPNKDSTTKAHKVEKKPDKNIITADSKTKTNKFDSSQGRDKNIKEIKPLVKEISEKESRSGHHVSYNERRGSDKGLPEKNSAKNGSTEIKMNEDKKKDESVFFITVIKDQKKLENSVNSPKTQDSVEGGRLKDKLEVKGNKQELLNYDEMKLREQKSNEIRVPSQNTDSIVIERKTKNPLNDSKKLDHKEYGYGNRKMSEFKKSDRNKDRLQDKESISKACLIYDEDEEQIEAYEVIIALCIYARVSFKNKIKLLFEITDVDDDGYINEDEIKKLIFTVHLNFSEEISPIDCKSYTLSQSLACIKAQQVHDMIINYPGNLKQTIVKEKYVQWENFYKSIERIPNYLYKVIPTFLNIRTSIETPRKEIDFKSLDLKNINEMLNLTKEICGDIKSSVNFMNKVTNKGEFNNIIYKGKKQEESQFNKIIEFENRLNRLIQEVGFKNSNSENLDIGTNHHISLEETMAIIKNNNGRSNDDLQDGEAAIINKVHEVNGIHDKLVQMFSKSSNIKIDHFYFDIN